MPKDTLFLDYETSSAVDLLRRGVYNYCDDSSTFIRLTGYAFNDSKVKVIEGPPTAELAEALRDPSFLKVASNAGFEYLVTKRVAGIDTDLKNWRCSDYLCRLSGCRPGLENQAIAFDMPIKKLDSLSKTKLLNAFSKQYNKNYIADPRNSLALWEMFIEYCSIDVEVSRSLYTHVRTINDPRAIDWALWRADFLVNSKGLRVDTELLSVASDLNQGIKDLALSSLKRRTGLPNPNSTSQYKKWLKDRWTLDLPNVRKDTLKSVMDDEYVDPEVKVSIALKGIVSSRSGDKFSSMNTYSNNDRVRGAYMASGASRTNRWSSKGAQMHNMAQGLPNDLEEIVSMVLSGASAVEFVRRWGSKAIEAQSTLVRGAIVASPGKKLLVADYSSIEVGTGALAAGDYEFIRKLKAGVDPYKLQASLVEKLQIEQVSKKMRSYYKPVVLGGQYGMGPEAMIAYAKSFGVSMDRRTSEMQIKAFRSYRSQLPDTWYGIAKAMTRAVRENVDVTSWRKVNRTSPLLVRKLGKHLQMKIPTGVVLTYLNAEPSQGKYGPSFTYEGNLKGGGWGKVHPHGGLVFENASQCIAGEVLRFAMVAYHCDKNQLGDWVGHAHDEAIFEVPEGISQEEAHAFANKVLVEDLKKIAPWSRKLPLSVSVDILDRYRKT